MEFWPRGGIIPDNYGLSLSVFSKDATTEKPILPGTPLVFDKASGAYGVRRATEGEVPELYSKVLMSEPDEAFGAYVSSKYVRNVKVVFSGVLEVGDSVVMGSDGKMKKADSKNENLVVSVNTANNTAEVLI